MRNRLEIRGHQAYMLYRNGLYYVQAGAYPDLASAVAEERRLKRAGIPTMIVAE
ncbi:MAG: SPOR domain-containing protein [Lachnospiraceae bacterium]|nr:SPOR domain-containing protein [Lachnospiraceae bacterium]